MGAMGITFTPHDARSQLKTSFAAFPVDKAQHRPSYKGSQQHSGTV
jgi:hypothetical protein